MQQMGSYAFVSLLLLPPLVESWSSLVGLSASHGMQCENISPYHHHHHRNQCILKAGNAEDLQREAERLREEVSAFERTKREKEEAERRAELEAKYAVQKAKDFYSASLPILKPDGSTEYEKVEFVPVSKKQDTKIEVLEGNLPLGMVLEEGDAQGTVVVEEVAPDSNAALAGVQKGDILRACTACKMNMEAPTWQLLAGGIGRPKSKRMMYVVDQRPFEEVMEAIASNRMDPEGRPVLLVVETARR